MEPQSTNGGSPTGPERLLILDRRRRVAEHYVRGVPQYKIAQMEGVHESQISRDLKHIRDKWLKSALMDFNERKARELAKIDDLELIARKAWHRSQEDAETTQTRDGASGVETTTTVKGQSGDPRFLERIAWCIEQRCKIAGLLKDVNIHVGDKILNIWEGVETEPGNVVVIEEAKDAC